jgi:hypothetical protein
VAEIKIERKRHSHLLPWIVGLVLLALVILAAASAAHRRAAAHVHRPGAAAVDTEWDNIPPKMRQYA